MGQTRMQSPQSVQFALSAFTRRLRFLPINAKKPPRGQKLRQKNLLVRSSKKRIRRRIPPSKANVLKKTSIIISRPTRPGGERNTKTGAPKTILKTSSLISVNQSTLLATKSPLAIYFLPVNVFLRRSNISRIKVTGHNQEQKTLPRNSAIRIGITIPTIDGRYKFLLIKRLSSPSKGETNHRLPIPKD